MGKRKFTHEEYVEMLKTLETNIEAIEQYINMSTKIKHKCLICGHEWYTTPAHIIHNHSGCPKCYGNAKKTHDEYVEELKIKNKYIEVIDLYINNRTKIMHKCLMCGYEWKVSPESLLRGSGCPSCHGGIKLTHEQYVAKLAIQNPLINVLGEYINSQTQILHKCKVCGYEWMVRPNNVLNGRGCPKCGGTTRKSHEQYVLELAEVNPNVIVLEKYINNSTKLKHRCLIDGCEWYAAPHSMLSGHGCPVCAKEKIKKSITMTHKEYINRLKLIHDRIVVIGQYINARTPIEHMCLDCGLTWYVAPGNLLSGHGCPYCNKIQKSNGEKFIANWLNKNNISYISQKTFDDCKDKYMLRFDFYLPEYNVAIEYQGKQHYEPIDYFGGQESFDSSVRRDKIKREYCIQNGILLLEIPYFADLNDELRILYDFILNDNSKEVA